MAGAYAMFDGKASPVTQTFGLGIASVPSVEELEKLEAFFLGRGAPVNHEISPLAGVELAATLAGRGYLPIEFTSVMHRAVEALPMEPDAAVTTRVTGVEEAGLWSRVSAEGWSENPEFREFLMDLGEVMTAAEGSVSFLAERNGRAIAAGSLRCEGGVAMFAGSCTIPDARNLGAQRALLQARMRYAAEAGCDLAMMCAAPGSASQRNAERQGFRIAYTRTKWCLNPSV